MTKQILTQSQLKKVIHYNSDTGEFTRRKCYFKSMEGQPAGWICKTWGYRLIRIDRIAYRASRLAVLYMDGMFPKDQVDHINHIRDDDRWVNLRVVTLHENLKNLTVQSNNTTGVTGLSWNKASGKYQGKINVNKKRFHLGYFSSLDEGKKAYEAAKIKYKYHPNHGSLKP